MERALATGETWREGRRVFFGFGVHKLQIWYHIVPYCLSLSLFLSGEEESTVWITHSLPLSPFLSQWGTRNENQKQYRPKMEKNTKKNNRESCRLDRQL